MGILSFLSGQQDQPVSAQSLRNVPHTRDLMYPAALPSFSDLAAGGHSDPRALVYTILRLGLEAGSRRHPFSVGDLSAGDFGEGWNGCKSAYPLLIEKGLIKNASTETLLSLCTVVELKSFLRARKLPVSGRKSVLIERLVNNGFKVRRREYRYMLFEFTDLGAGIVRQYYSDRCLAFLRAVYALIDGDYSGAISALRGFDNKWGFSHSSGKKHTIFAHFDVPFGQFEFIAKYPMRELQNTENFKSTFRSYLIASLMCGVHTPYGAELVEELCHEQIRCPRIVDYYARSMTLGELMENKDMLSAMRENVASDNSYVLEYYVSRVMYLSRRSCK